jgi:TolB-like protein
MLKELRRRNVHRVAIVYLAGSWLLIQIVATLTPTFFSEGLFRTTVILLTIGFIPALILAWKFEWTPEGLQREADVPAKTPRSDPRMFDRLITATLVLAVAFFAVDRFALDPARDEALQQQAEERGRAAALVESYGDKSIAVLPFADMSPDGDQEYFSDGIAEEILNLLAGVRDIRVVSRSSAFRYRGGDIHIPTVAEELNVSYVLEGSVRKAGDRLRITAQLIDARADAHVWSVTYDRRFADVFAIQDEISQEIVGELNETLLGESTRVARTDPETYALYLQARYMFHVQMGDYLTVEKLLTEVLARDPDYVPALNLMVNAIFFLSGDKKEGRKYSHEEGSALMRPYVDRALAIDADNALANANRGWLALFYSNDLETAVTYTQRALDADPRDGFVLHIAGVISRRIGRYEDAIAFEEAALERDPLCSLCLYGLMMASTRSGDYEKALETSTRRMRLAEGGWFTRGFIHLLMGDAQTALELYENPKEDRVGWLAYSAIAHHELGNIPARDAALEELTTIDARRAIRDVAAIHAWLGNIDEAFTWLDRYVDPHSPALGRDAEGIIWHPKFRNLRDDPRWLELRRRVGLDPERLAGIRLQLPSR